VSIKNLKSIPGLRSLNYGTRVTIDSLNGKEIIIRDFVEVNNTKFGPANGTYLRIAADVVVGTGSNTPVTFNTSSTTIRQLLRKAQDHLPVKTKVSQIQSKKGPYAYWTLQ